MIAYKIDIVKKLFLNSRLSLKKEPAVKLKPEIAKVTEDRVKKKSIFVIEK